MRKLEKLIKLSFLTVLFFSVVGCVSPIFDVNVSDPEVSGLTYENTSSETQRIFYSNSRSEDEVMGTGAFLTYNLNQNDAAINEIEYLMSGVSQELSARGVNVVFADDPSSEAGAKIDINSLKLINHRVSGFSPLVSLTSLSADIEGQDSTVRVVSFIKRGKVPVWTMTEEGIVENVFNQPLTVLVQDFSSLINQSLFGYKVSDSDVDTLIESINSDIAAGTYNYLDVYKLGFSNNMRVVDTLVELVESPDEYVRLAAISSLGLLKAEDQMGLLKELYASSSLWQDRGMALKSIGNMGTSESIDFLQTEKAKIDEAVEKNQEQIWNGEIIDLFI